MTLHLRKSNERAFIDHGWLKSYHTFSFGSYYDERFMGFRTLRVINEDRVEPNEGFPLHSHKNMEILTYVIEGELAHKDSLGHASTIHQGEAQLMHAGTGISHSEYNPSPNQAVHFLQIWILPDRQEVEPGYKQMFPKLKKNSWTLIASKDGRENSLVIYQDASVSLLDLEGTLERSVDRYGWLQVIEGALSVNELTLTRGDAVAIDPPTTLRLQAKSPSKLLFFELS